jgi:hypothetical protein
LVQNIPVLEEIEADWQLSFYDKAADESIGVRGKSERVAEG